MPHEFNYTSIQDAIAILTNAIRASPRVEKVDVRRAYGRVLAADVLAQEDSPRRDVSHFDGFAISSKDTLEVSDARPASFSSTPGPKRVGLLPKKRLQRGQAMKVATGGFLPSGADAVVPAEEVVVRGDRIEVSRPVDRGSQVYRAGADWKKGNVLLQEGRTLKGQDLALLASAHIEELAAFARPVVAIIPTGTELTAKIGDERSGKVVESHSLMLRHLVEEAGGTHLVLPIVPDDRGHLSSALKNSLRRADIVFTLAGSSVGEPDLVDSAIRGLGRSTSALVHGIKVHRGRVMGVAVVGGKPIVIFPGPIQAALNAFIVFGYPLVRRHLGSGFEQPPGVTATLEEGWEAAGRFKDFDQIVYLRLSRDVSSPNELLAFPGSAETEKVSFLVSKNAYTMVPGSVGRLMKGDRVLVRLLPGFSSLDQ